MTPLRKKMIRELELQRKSPKTVSAYVWSVAQLAKFHGKSPVQPTRPQFSYVLRPSALPLTANRQRCPLVSRIRFLPTILGKGVISSVWNAMVCFCRPSFRPTSILNGVSPLYEDERLKLGSQ